MYVVICSLNQSVSFISNSSGTYKPDIFKKVDNEGLLYCEPTSSHGNQTNNKIKMYQ